MKYFFQFLFLFFLHDVYAQTYVPSDTVHNQYKILSTYFEARTKNLVEDFKTHPSYNRKLVKNFRKSREKTIETFLEGSFLYFDVEVENYLNQLLQNIITSNAIEAESLRIFVSRETQPNAMSLGDGNFIFNLSLLNRLETEDEVNFVISHELSHFLLKHFEKSMEARMELLASDEYQQKKKKAKKGRYNKFSKQVKAFRSFQYGDKESSRQRELEADSLGFILFSKVAHSPADALSALSKLDTLSPSEVLQLDLATIKNHFTAPNLAFDEDWTVGVDFSKYNYQTGKVDLFGTHKDSLKSHPEIQKRLHQLDKNFPEANTHQVFNSEEWNHIREKIRLEDVYAHLCSDEYGRGIYFIIQLQNADDVTAQQNAFYNQMLSVFYERLHSARKSFTFGKYVDEVDVVNYSKEYNLFLTIIDKLRSSELLALSEKYKSQLNPN